MAIPYWPQDFVQKIGVVKDYFNITLQGLERHRVHPLGKTIARAQEGVNSKGNLIIQKITRNLEKSEFPIIAGFRFLPFIYLIWYIGLDLQLVFYLKRICQT